jgi:hypothetical protein
MTCRRLTLQTQPRDAAEDSRRAKGRYVVTADYVACMDLLRRPEAKAVIFAVIVGLGVLAIILHSTSQHSGASRSSVSPITPSPTPSPSVSPSAGESISPSPSPSLETSSPPPVPVPQPAGIVIGRALCEPKNYSIHVTHTTVLASPRTVRYDLVATPIAKPDCFLVDYPNVNVKPSQGAQRRDLNPSGGILQGVGQAPPLHLVSGRTIKATITVTGNTCNGERLRDVRVDSTLVAPTIGKWCKIVETYWQYLNGPSQNPGVQDTGCQPVNLGAQPLPLPTKVGSAVRYQVTLFKKPGSDCDLTGYLRLSATTPDGIPHELPVVKRKAPFPTVTLSPGTLLTATLDIVSSASCSGNNLATVRLENIPLQFANPTKTDPKYLNIAKNWCSIRESYWTVVG